MTCDGPRARHLRLLVVAFGACAHRLGRWSVTAPIVFVTAGAIIGFAFGSPTASEVIWVRGVAEMTLVLVLFHDAAQVRPAVRSEVPSGTQQLRR